MQDIFGERASEVRSVLVDKMFSQAPGVYTLLKGLVKKKLKRDIVEVFLQDPRAVYDLLMEQYRDSFTATFIFRNLFIKPLAEYLGLYDYVDDLTKAAIAGCDELVKLLDSLKPSVSINEIGLCLSTEERLVEAIPVKGSSGGRKIRYLVPSKTTASMLEEFEF